MKLLKTKFLIGLEKHMLKKIIYLAIFLLITQIVSAAEVCVVIDYGADKDQDSKCITTEEGINGYEFLNQLDYNIGWKYFGYNDFFAMDLGHGLCSIESVGENTDVCWGTSTWNMNLAQEGEWYHLQVGTDAEGGCWNRNKESGVGHYCPVDGDLLGLAFGEWGARPDMLKLNDINAYVNDKKTSKADEDGGTITVKPDSTLRLEIELENLFIDDTDMKINDLEATAIIKEIDDDSDIEEDSDSIDLDTEDEDTLEIEFEIPLEVKHGSYDMQLTITGEDDNSIQYSKNVDFKVKVEKEKHELLVQEFTLADTTLTCRRGTSIDVTVLNLGRNKEDVKLRVFNDDLEINIKDEFELDKDPFDSDSVYSNSYSFNIEQANEGTYPITLLLEYEKKKDTKTIDLKIVDCATTKEESVAVKTKTVENPPKLQAMAVAEESQLNSINKPNNDLLIIVTLVVAIIIAIALGIILASKIK